MLCRWISIRFVSDQLDICGPCNTPLPTTQPNPTHTHTTGAYHGRANGSGFNEPDDWYEMILKPSQAKARFVYPVPCNRHVQRIHCMAYVCWYPRPAFDCPGIHCMDSAGIKPHCPRFIHEPPSLFLAVLVAWLHVFCFQLQQLLLL